MIYLVKMGKSPKKGVADLVFSMDCVWPWPLLRKLRALPNCFADLFAFAKVFFAESSCWRFFICNVYAMFLWTSGVVLRRALEVRMIAKGCVVVRTPVTKAVSKVASKTVTKAVQPLTHTWLQLVGTAPPGNEGRSGGRQAKRSKRKKSIAFGIVVH